MSAENTQDLSSLSDMSRLIYDRVARRVGKPGLKSAAEINPEVDKQVDSFIDANSFVTGFFVKCAEEAAPSCVIESGMRRLCEQQPLIAQAFKNAGFTL